MTAWLIDKSAFVRLYRSPDAGEWASAIERGFVRVSTVTKLEIGFSAQSAEELRREMSMPPLTSMPVEYLTPSIEDRAVEVQLAMFSARRRFVQRWRKRFDDPSKPVGMQRRLMRIVRAAFLMSLRNGSILMCLRATRCGSERLATRQKRCSSD